MQYDHYQFELSPFYHIRIDSKEDFEDSYTNGVIGIRKSKKGRQHNIWSKQKGQKDKQ